MVSYCHVIPGARSGWRRFHTIDFFLAPGTLSFSPEHYLTYSVSHYHSGDYNGESFCRFEGQRVAHECSGEDAGRLRPCDRATPTGHHAAALREEAATRMRPAGGRRWPAEAIPTTWELLLHGQDGARHHARASRVRECEQRGAHGRARHPHPGAAALSAGARSRHCFAGSRECGDDDGEGCIGRPRSW
ncbi:hypothetical protein VPH35_091960 [Triticum aestivum]|uniref:Uncharacterized protein n=1 Tax=Triticum turgidum subsp. durum TaxID=4567 RepID=A0A9R0XFM0_TRITD|nr:unnamed protein product [Triticum turgidum subsp. durum]